MAPGVGFEPTRPKRVTGSQGPLVNTVIVESQREKFIDYLKGEVSENTAINYGYKLNMLIAILPETFTPKDINQTLKSVKNPNTRGNMAKVARHLLRFLGHDESEIEIPKPTPNPIFLPSKEQIMAFYHELPERSKIAFLILASSGMRPIEMLPLRVMDIKVYNEVGVINLSQIHEGDTKRSWMACVNNEVLSWIKEHDIKPEDRIYPYSKRVLNKDFQLASKKSGIHMYPYMLRDLFLNETRKRGMPREWRLVLTGHILRDVLQDHYELREAEEAARVYNQTGLRILA
ncbi:MAG: tyrosine-type recombinase/integrase [archaeon]|nr:tyrosine-type recombinase/integrase [archaeon]MCP8312965.1 tyrosine-type recombinase/integrase [archaeon]